MLLDPFAVKSFFRTYNGLMVYSFQSIPAVC